MPLVALGIAAGVAGGAASAYGAHKQAQSSDKAAALSSQSNAAALAEQQKQDALQKQEFDQQQSASKAQWDAEQAIRAPYRQAGANALSSLGGILGVDFGNGGGSAPAAAPAASSAPADVQAFISQWQADPMHPASEGIGPLSQAIAAKFPNVSRYMYGATPSNNELSIGGQKYKVLGAENGPNAYWYTPGTNDSAPAAVAGGAARTIAPLAMAMSGNALAPSYAPVVPISALMGGR